MHISTNTTDIGTDQLISRHRLWKLRKSEVYLELINSQKSIIKTLTPVVHCAVKCLIEWRVWFSRKKKRTVNRIKTPMLKLLIWNLDSVYSPNSKHFLFCLQLTSWNSAQAKISAVNGVLNLCSICQEHSTRVKCKNFLENQRRWNAFF